VAIAANRRRLLQALDEVEAGQLPPGLARSDVAGRRIGPDTVDGIAPAGQWQSWWRDQVRQRRETAPWLKPKVSS
jgi:phthalate 4,5-dioxygenase oxygenase subunit